VLRLRRLPFAPLAVTAALLTACGGSSDEDAAPAAPAAASTTTTSTSTTTAVPLPTTFEGDPLGPRLLGAWEEPEGSGGGPYRWTLASAGSPDCVEVAKSDGDCYVVRAVEDGVVEDWGDARMQGDVLVTRQRGGDEASAQCVDKVSSFRFAIGDDPKTPVQKGGCRQSDRTYLTKGYLTRIP
jgi:hypothetical protein